MPSKQDQKKFIERDSLLPYGAGGEPPGEPPAPPPGFEPRSRGLSEQLIEQALDGARLRSAIRALPAAERRRLAEAVLDELGEDHELPEVVSERLLDAMLGGLLAGKRSECEILGRDGLLASSPAVWSSERWPRS
jgi:hypothetical protein